VKGLSTALSFVEMCESNFSLINLPNLCKSLLLPIPLPESLTLQIYMRVRFIKGSMKVTINIPRILRATERRIIKE